MVSCRLRISKETMMNPWSGYHLAEALAERRRRHADPMRHNSALASTIRYWLKLGRPAMVAPPPVARVLQADRGLEPRIASGLELQPVRPGGVRAVETLLRHAD